MKTSRERRSSSGQASRCTGGWTTCWTAFDEQRPLAADVEQPLDAEDSRAACLEQHRQPDPERRASRPARRARGSPPRTSSCACVVRARGRRATPPLDGRALAAAQERAGSTSPEGDAERRTRPGSAPRATARARRAGVGEVGLRHDEHVRRRDLAARTPRRGARAARRPSRRRSRARSGARTSGSETSVVTIGVGSATPVVSTTTRRERRDLARRPPVDEVAELVGEVAAQRAADAAAREQDGALVDVAQEVRGRCRSRRARSRSPPCRRAPGREQALRMSVVLPLPRKPVTRTTGVLTASAATSTGSSGSSGVRRAARPRPRARRGRRPRPCRPCRPDDVAAPPTRDGRARSARARGRAGRRGRRAPAARRPARPSARFDRTPQSAAH